MTRASALRLAALSLFVSFPACGDLLDTADAPPTAISRASLDARFAAAAAAYDVPVSLLKSIGYAETRWQMVHGHQEFDGMPAAFGIMALRGDRLAEAARLTGRTEAQVKTDVDANLKGAAALLRAYADAAGIDRTDLAAWGPVVARFSGIEGQDAQASYVHTEVYDVLGRGVQVEDDAGRLLGRIDAQPVMARFPLPEDVAAKAMAVDYPGAVWRASPNFNSRPTGVNAQMVIVHTCEGSYSGCWGWLTNSSSGVSAHYVVNDAGTEVSQLVNEDKRAWHIGASYDCSLNGNTKCNLNGTSSNNFTIGIEHAGYASQTSFPAGQISKSAHLGCDISNGWNIPRDGYHFVAHGKLQPATRVDPGPNWPWTSYLSQINANCTTEIIVDDNNANNNASFASFTASANWVTTTSTPGYYGSGYKYASAQAISDVAEFKFYLSSAQTRTIDARWTAGTNRSTSAPFVVTNASGTTLATVNVNQTTGGGTWNVLGTWSFPAGWNSVKVSRWTSATGVIIADAIRVR